MYRSGEENYPTTCLTKIQDTEKDTEKRKKSFSQLRLKHNICIFHQPAEACFFKSLGYSLGY